jgi:WD40-like Beta Propeller Repeat
MARILRRRSIKAYTILNYLVLVLLAQGSSMYVNAQIISNDKGLNSNKADQAIFEEGEYWFEIQNYKAAYTEYHKLIERYPNEEILNYRIGVCELFFNDKWEKALLHLQALPYDKYKKTDYTFYLACAYHYNLLFDNAIMEFNNFLGSKKGTKAMKDEARFYIKNCENGKDLKSKPVDIKITNVGDPINSPSSEYVPLISANEQVMVFTYRGEHSIGGKQFVPGKKNANEGEYYEDIMFTQKDSSGHWEVPVLLNTNINTLGNDACVSLSHDGQKLTMFRSVMGDLGTLFETKLNGKDWEDPIIIPGNVNTKSWEGSITYSPNGKTAYFASERPGGKGGRDIYRASLLPDGTWGNIVNAGDSINTTQDDDAPFYHPSGQYLIICSRGHKSMGGFDIFLCERINDTTWTKPKNLGYPINTPGEDIYYSISADGKKGYYSSGKAGGYGQQDIYVVEPGLPGIKIKLLQISGTITLNDRPIDADLEINFTNTGNNYAVQRSNSATGKYLAELPAGNDFSLKYKLPGMEPQLRAISSKDLNEFLETTIDVQFYSEDYLTKIKRQKDSLENLTKPVVVTEVKKDTAKVSFNDQYANSKAEGLVFRVQIGAYNLPQNFNYSTVMKMNKVEKLKLDDNVTRFVMGKFDTYGEAKVFRDKVIAAGITDAFITAIYKDKRVYIVDLVAQGIFKK